MAPDKYHSGISGFILSVKKSVICVGDFKPPEDTILRKMYAHPMASVCALTLLAALHMRNLHRADALRAQTRILSHHLTMGLTLCALLQLAIYSTLFLLDAGCAPVLHGVLFFLALADVCVVAVLLLRVYHAHGNPRWLLVLALLVLGVRIYENIFIGQNVQIIDDPAEGHCAFHIDLGWGSGLIHWVLSMEGFTVLFLIITFFTAQNRSLTARFLAPVLWMAIGWWLVHFIPGLVHYLGAAIAEFVNFAVLATLIVNLLEGAQKLRLENLGARILGAATSGDHGALNEGYGAA